MAWKMSEKANKYQLLYINISKYYKTFNFSRNHTKIKMCIEDLYNHKCM